MGNTEKTTTKMFSFVYVTVQFFCNLLLANIFGAIHKVTFQIHL